MFEIEAAILAGGRSRRMGRDKALLPFGGYTTLAEYQYRRLRRLFPRVGLSAKEAKFPFEAELILDNDPLSAPLTALEAILDSARSDWVFVLGVDMPFVDEETIRSLLAARGGEEDLLAVCAADAQGRAEPLCGLYHRDALVRIRAHRSSGELRLRALIAALPHRLVSVAPEALLNLNRPGEYARALKKLGED